MSKVLDGLISRNFEDIRGAHVTGSVPVTEQILNEAVSRRIAKARGRIQQFDIQIGADNFIEVGMKVAVGPFSKWFRPEVTVQAMAQPPAVILKLASREYAGLMWLVDLFAKELFPAGLRIQGQQIVVDLASLPALADFRGLLAALRRFDIKTVRGRMVIEFEIKIDGVEESQDGMDRRAS